jgi:hypothetical protein
VAMRERDTASARRAIEADIEETTGLLLKRAIFEDDPVAPVVDARLHVVSSR